MPKYLLLAKVDQIVTKEVKFEIVAASEEEAQAKAREALQAYPQAIKIEGINRIMTNKTQYWIPRSIEFSSTKEEND